MNKISLEKQKNALVITNYLLPQEGINMRELDMLNRGMLEGFIPVGIFQHKKSNCLKCAVVGKIPLEQYIKGVINKKTFIDLIFRLMKPIRNCDRNRLQIRNLELDPSLIFIDPATGELAFIYWPVGNPAKNVNIYEFFRDIVFKAVFNRYEDTRYVADYINFFRNLSSFTLNDLEKFMMSLSGMSPEMPKNNVPVAPSGRTDSSMQINNIQANNSAPFPPVNGVKPVYPPVNGAMQGNLLVNGANPVYPPATNVRQENLSVNNAMPGNILVNATKQEYPPVNAVPVQQNIPVQAPVAPATAPAAPENNMEDKVESQSFNETTILAEEDTGGTTVLGADELNGPVFPYIIRESNNERITVDKPVFRIGKEKQYCDYFVSDNNAVSRSHADIITKGNRYFIYDNNSTNKTFVEERPIAVQQEVEIFSGTKFRLGNERFTFYI